MAGFNVQAARNAGYSDAEIVDHLSKESGLDAAGARAAGYSDGELIVHLLGKDPTTGGARTEGAADLQSQSPEVLAQRRGAMARERQEGQNLIDAAEANPTKGQNNFLTGIGKSFADTGRGLKQIGAEVADFVAPRQKTVGDLVSGNDPSRAAAVTREIDESRRLDQPLMRTGAGNVGNIAGAVAQTIPLAMVPGANTFVGGALTGAGLGATQPVGTGESRAVNTGLGAAAGLGGMLAARTVGSVWRGVKALAEPFTKGGPERIAGRTLERFGVTPQDTLNLSNTPSSTGARPTLAEQITRPEGAAAAARLQDQLKMNPQVAAQMTTREGENNAARVATLERNAAPRDAAAEARSATASPLYESAKAQVIDAAALPPAAQAEFAKLMQTPAIRTAMYDAAEVLANKGGGAAPNTIEALHEAKLAIDSRINKLTAGNPNAAQMSDAMGLKMAQDRLVKFIESQSPDYSKARASYAELSKPVNQADIAGELLNKGSANTTDLSGTARLMPDKLTGAIRDEGKLMKSATGRNLGDDLSKVMTPQQLSDIRAVVGEVDKAAAVARAGNGPGSATAQRLSGTNIVEQMVRGSGLPESTTGSTIAQELLARPLTFLYSKVAEPKLQMTLGEIILNPNLANKAMSAASAPQRKALARVLSNKYLKQAAVASLPSASLVNRR